MKTIFKNMPYLKFFFKGKEESTNKTDLGKTFRHEFVHTIPDILEDDTLYISFRYNTMIHKCACGCGEEVVTKLSPTNWYYIYDGATISVYPSIGNWNYDCKSHYWIRKSQIIWAERWSEDKIRRVREYEMCVNKNQ